MIDKLGIYISAVKSKGRPIAAENVEKEINVLFGPTRNARRFEETMHGG